MKTERRVRSSLQEGGPEADDPLARAVDRFPVLVIGPVPPPYHGGAMATRHLLDSRLAREFRLVHLDTTDRRGLENIGRLDAVNVLLALVHFGRFMRLLLQQKPRLVYVPIAQNRLGFLRDCLFLIPALAARKPVVVHLHGGGFAEFARATDALTRALVRGVLRRVTRVIVLGQVLADRVRPLAAGHRLAVVPNGIDDPIGRQTSAVGGRIDDAAKRAPLTILYLGTLTEAKGFLDLIEAVKTLVGRGYGLRLVLAGPFLRPTDREKAGNAARGFESHIEFAGVVEGGAKASRLVTADIFAFPTKYENEAHPYVVLEAMAAGLPVIATPRAAIAETVVTGVTGALVPEGDVPALASSIASLADDSALRQRMGEAGRRRFEELYTIDRWSERISAVLREALGDPPPVH